MLEVLALRVALQRLVARLEEPVCEEDAPVRSCQASGSCLPTWSLVHLRAREYSDCTVENKVGATSNTSAMLMLTC